MYLVKLYAKEIMRLITDYKVKAFNGDLGLFQLLDYFYEPQFQTLFTYCMNEAEIELNDFIKGMNEVVGEKIAAYHKEIASYESVESEKEVNENDPTQL